MSFKIFPLRLIQYFFSSLFVSETTSNKYRFEWELKWDELKKKGVKHLFGTITPETNDKLVPSIDFSVDEKRSTSNLETSKDWLYNIPFKYKIFYKESDYSGLTLEELFKPSERNDAVLVIGGTKMHVNKAVRCFFAVAVSYIYNFPVAELPF